MLLNAFELVANMCCCKHVVSNICKKNFVAMQNSRVAMQKFGSTYAIIMFVLVVWHGLCFRF